MIFRDYQLPGYSGPHCKCVSCFYFACYFVIQLNTTEVGYQIKIIIGGVAYNYTFIFVINRCSTSNAIIFGPAIGSRNSHFSDLITSLYKVAIAINFLEWELTSVISEQGMDTCSIKTGSGEG